MVIFKVILEKSKIGFNYYNFEVRTPNQLMNGAIDSEGPDKR